MKLNKLKFTRLQNEVFALLCVRAGEPLTQFEIAKKLGVSQAAVAKSIPLMKDEGLIKAEKKHGRLSIGIDRENNRAMELKMVENLRMIFESGLVTTLEDAFPGTAIILFGSYSRGEDTIRSDIDIAVVGSRGKDLRLESLEKAFEREITLHFYGSFDDMGKELKENILSGILLAGRIEL